MRTSLRRLTTLALGAVALLGLPAPSAGAEGFGEIPGLYGVDQAAKCETNPAIGLSNFGFLSSASGEDITSTECGNVTDRDRVKQRLKCRTDPANALLTPQADRRTSTRCFNAALDGEKERDDRHDDRHEDRHEDRHGDQHGY